MTGHCYDARICRGDGLCQCDCDFCTIAEAAARPETCTTEPKGGRHIFANGSASCDCGRASRSVRVEHTAETIRPPAKGGCPCEHVEPCAPDCTCVNQWSSFGCRRCCKYGSPEQQYEMALTMTKTAAVDKATLAFCRNLLKDIAARFRKNGAGRYMISGTLTQQDADTIQIFASGAPAFPPGYFSDVFADDDPYDLPEEEHEG